MTMMHMTANPFFRKDNSKSSYLSQGKLATAAMKVPDLLSMSFPVSMGSHMTYMIFECPLLPSCIYLVVNTTAFK